MPLWVLLLLLIALYAALLLLLSRGLPRAVLDLPLSEDETTLSFGPDFAFGTSTSAWQVEREVARSNWSVGESLDAGGRPLIPPHGEAVCDALDRFDGDLQLMRSMNMRRYRFGVSWAALERADGEFDSAYLQRYVSMCDALMRSGIEPMVTLLHFEHPEWLEREGGVLSPRFVELFARFADFVVSGLRGHCRLFFTINEPFVFAFNCYAAGVWMPAHHSLSELFRCVAALMEAHARAYHIIHEMIPDAKVSFADNIVPFYPRNKYNLLEVLIARVANLYNIPILESVNTGVLKFGLFGINVFTKRIEGLKDSYDFISVNHYFCGWASLRPRDWDRHAFPPPLSGRLDKYQPSDFGWPIIPSSLATSVQWIHERYNPRNVDIIVSEHGIADQTDEKRPRYLLDSLAYLKYVKEKCNVPVSGYLHWSLLDNYEWAEGYKMKFGLIEVNMENQERKEKVSADLYRKIAKHSY